MLIGLSNLAATGKIKKIYLNQSEVVGVINITTKE